MEEESAPQHEHLEEALGEALGESPRAQELHDMATLLEQRRIGMAAELKELSDEAAIKKVRRALAQLDEQIAVLKEEASITRFVEESVRAGVNSAGF